MKDRETPLKLVRLWEKMTPGVYNTLNDLRDANGQDGLCWPDYCELPIGAAFTYLVDTCQVSPEDAAAGAAELTACWTWRQHKIIYSFDDDFAAMLTAQAEDMEDTDVLPTDLLFHLPYPCVYIKARILDGFDGFWSWVEYDINEHRAEFRIQWVMEDMSHSVPYVLHLLPGKALKDCIEDTAEETLRHMDLDIKPERVEMDESLKKESLLLLRPMQLILYFLSERADLEELTKATLKKENGGARIIQDKASEVKEYSVGIRIGGAIRKYRVAPQSKPSGSGGTKRPHSRRGHWHHYWMGPMTGERKLVLQWTAPTFIHPDAPVDDSVVIFPVKDQ